MNIHHLRIACPDDTIIDQQAMKSTVRSILYIYINCIKRQFPLIGYNISFVPNLHRR